MTNHRHTITAAISALTAVVCLWASRDLLECWQLDPYSKHCEWVFLTWIATSAWMFFRDKDHYSVSLELVSVAALFFLFGRVSDISALSHLALSFAVASFLPTFIQRCCCLALSISWFPSVGWVAHHFLSIDVSSLRLLAGLILAGMVIFICLRKYPKNQKLSPAL